MKIKQSYIQGDTVRVKLQHANMRVFLRGQSLLSRDDASSLVLHSQQ